MKDTTHIEEMVLAVPTLTFSQITGCLIHAQCSPIRSEVSPRGLSGARKANPCYVPLCRRVVSVRVRSMVGFSTHE
jgi:hypothetical protein